MANRIIPGKMLNSLDKDNDNSVKGKEFQRARMLDMFLATRTGMKTSGDGTIQIVEKIRNTSRCRNVTRFSSHRNALATAKRYL